MSRPASMRLAMAISPSRDSSSTAAHLAQIHAHRIVGAADIVVVDIAGGLAFLVLFLVFASASSASPRPALRLLALDDVDAHLGEHRHRVLDLLGGHLLRRQRGVQLVIGDVAALLAAREHLLDGGADAVHQRAVAGLLTRFPALPLLPASSLPSRTCSMSHAVVQTPAHGAGPRPLPMWTAHVGRVPSMSRRRLSPSRVACRAALEPREASPPCPLRPTVRGRRHPAPVAAALAHHATDRSNAQPVGRAIRSPPFGKRKFACPWSDRNRACKAPAKPVWSRWRLQFVGVKVRLARRRGLLWPVEACQGDATGRLSLRQLLRHARPPAPDG